MLSFFDSHAHLTSLSDLPEYFCLNVTTCSSEWQKAISQHKTYPNILPSLGIHPWYVNDVLPSDLVTLASLLATNNVFAVGEIGLDFTKQHIATKNLQLHFLEQQLFMAKSFQLPVSIHCVKAHNEMLNMLSSSNLGKAGVIHGLGASIELVQRYIDIGYKIGINGVTCRSNARRYHEMVKHFSLDYFVLETDYPNVMLPHHEIVSPDDIHSLASKVSELTGKSIEEVVEQTRYNAEQIFLR